MLAVEQFWIGSVEKEALFFLIEPSETVTLCADLGASGKMGVEKEMEYCSFLLGLGCLAEIDGASGCVSLSCGETYRWGRRACESWVQIDSLRQVYPAKYFLVN